MLKHTTIEMGYDDQSNWCNYDISRRCYDFLDLLLQEWQTHSLERWELVFLQSKMLKGAFTSSFIIHISMVYKGYAPLLFISQAHSSSGWEHQEGN